MKAPTKMLPAQTKKYKKHGNMSSGLWGDVIARYSQWPMTPTGVQSIALTMRSACLGSDCRVYILGCTHVASQKGTGSTHLITHFYDARL